MRVLIGYASRFGSTRDIAHANCRQAPHPMAATSTFAQSMRSRTLIRMMPLYSGVVCTTDRGRQKPLTLCNDTPQSSRANPFGCSVLDLLVINTRLSAD